MFAITVFLQGAQRLLYQTEARRATWKQPSRTAERGCTLPAPLRGTHAGQEQAVRPDRSNKLPRTEELYTSAAGPQHCAPRPGVQRAGPVPASPSRSAQGPATGGRRPAAQLLSRPGGRRGRPNAARRPLRDGGDDHRAAPPVAGR